VWHADDGVASKTRVGGRGRQLRGVSQSRGRGVLGGSSAGLDGVETVSVVGLLRLQACGQASVRRSHVADLVKQGRVGRLSLRLQGLHVGRVVHGEPV